MAESATTVDGMLSAAARMYPRKTAIKADYGDIRYAEADRAATMCASALRGLLGDERCVVAIASPLHPDFMTAFYGVIRSGNIAAPMHPMLPPHMLQHLLEVSDARLVFVTTELFAQLRRIRGRLPRLKEAVLIGPGPVADANDIRTIDDLSAAYEVRGNAMAPAAEMSPDDVACVQFTSGTTALPRGALLTHRNLTVNAAQVAAAHGLDAESVVLNHLPKFHLMHMNAVVQAGAVHVPCVEPGNRVAIEKANESGATHFYTIPMKLNRLAADAELPGLRLHTVRMIASGGSALSGRVGAKLTDHFRIPVFQGYGLAETSPLTHSARPDDPRPGSVGPVVEGTECRIVDLETRRVLPAGGRGEVQVRGPQVMKGYLDPEEPSGIDAEGWLATGDIGYVDDDGFLFVVDRIKDLFKCDNDMVSPAEIEELLDAHPRVRESAVVDFPDPASGAVANAFVALETSGGDAAGETSGDGPGDAAAGSGLARLLAEIAEFAARDVPYHQHVRHVEVVDRVPRSPNGKVQRRDLRAELITRRELAVLPGGGRPRTPRGVCAEGTQDLSGLITVVARFATKGDPRGFEKFFLEHVEFMRAQEGFGSHQAATLAGDASVYLNFGWWLEQTAFQRVAQSAEFREHQAAMRSMLQDAEVELCRSLFRVPAAEPDRDGEEAVPSPMRLVSYELTGAAKEFEDAYVEYARQIRTAPGFRYANLNRSMQSPGRYCGIEYWWEGQSADSTAVGSAHRRLSEVATVRVELLEHVAGARASAPSAARRPGHG